ncbi:MAG: DUF2333 family protein [Gammaproteobacteria bacterium]
MQFNRFFDSVTRNFTEHRFGRVGGILSALIGVYILVTTFLLFYWSQEPAIFNVQKVAAQDAHKESVSDVTGYTYTTALIHIGDTLLYKRGGYLSNDITPPGVFMDDIPNWEFGALVMLRDATSSLRNYFSRSQSQSIENPDLAIADPKFNYDNNSWLFTEREYRKAIAALKRYRDGLAKTQDTSTQFYARADNLAQYLTVVSQRLGSLSQRLSASVGQLRVNTDLAGDSAAKQSTATGNTVMVKTPWLKIDDIFYEARGSTWALYHILSAINVDFDAVLRKKNAKPSVEQIISELREAQRPTFSPMVLNGEGFGLTANYSLTMANYISRVNAAIIDLRALLQNG